MHVRDEFVFSLGYDHELVYITSSLTTLYCYEKRKPSKRAVCQLCVAT